MAFTIEKVMLANIKLSGMSATFPIVHVYVKEKANQGLTDEEKRAFAQSLNEKVQGMRPLVGSWFNGYQHQDWHDWDGLTTGTYTFGGNTGFKMVLGISTSWGVINRVNFELWYNNEPICTYSSATGYSLMEVGVPYIITDNEGNYYAPYYYGTGTFLFYLRNASATQADIYVTDGIYLQTMINDPFTSIWCEARNAWSSANGTFYYRSTGNISGDIDSEVDPSETDPYKPGGETEPGGGDGPYGPNGEDITDPELPDVDAVSTGFITLFNPSVSELNNLASYMWSGGFDINTFKKLFANPMDCILGLSILPKIVPNGGSANVLVGNIDTGVSMTKAARQYIKFDCGSINIERYSNSFLDYSPYTKIYLYLPFIGIHEISTDDVMNKTLQVKYSIDILSGACVAFVIAGGTTLYSYIGQCAASVPVTSQDWSTMINGVLGAVGSIASTVGAIASGDIGGAIRGAASTAQSVLNSKPDVQHSGSMGGMGGMLGIKTPFVIIERPSQAIPKRQNEYIGYPSFVTKNFDDLTGYNEIYSTHLHDIPCTENELKEIESLLKSGVIF